MKAEHEAKVEAVKQIDSGIMQHRFRVAYLKKQLADLPVPADGAPEAEKQAYAREKVKIDAAEAELEANEAYRAFIRDTFNV